MQSYRLVPEDDWKELVRLVVRVGALIEQNTGTSVLSMSVPASTTVPVPEKPEAANVAARKPEVTSVGTVKKYRIARDAWKYADVVAQEMTRPEFTLDDVVKLLDPIMETESSRPRDGIRVALDRDERFQRIQSDSGIVVWKRIDPSQTELASE